MYKTILYIFFYTSFSISSLFSWETCNEYNFDRAIDIQHEMYNLFDTSQDYQWEACTYGYDKINSAKDIQRRLNKVDKAISYLKKSAKKATQAKDEWYDLHTECVDEGYSTNGDTAYQAYKDIGKWSKKYLWGRRSLLYYAEACQRDLRKKLIKY